MIVAPATPLRAAIYCRVSTDRQEQDGSSLDSQEAAGRTYCDERNYTIVAIYREAFSGGEFHDRPRLGELRASIRAGVVDVVVAYAVDRVSRDQTHIWVLLDELDRGGARLELVTEPLDQTPTGKFLLSARAFAAEVERHKRREQTSRAVRTRAVSGLLYAQGSSLFGYARVPGQNRRRVVADQAAVVRDVFTWYVSGVAVREIVQRLRDENRPSPGAGRAYANGRPGPVWGTTAVYRILTDPAYKGETYALRFDGRAKPRPRDEWVALPHGVTPAIVSAELWEAAQARLATNEGAATRNRARPYLLRAFMVCGVCGQKMYSSAESKGRRSYRCRSRDTVTGARGAARVPGPDVERWVWDEVSAILHDPSIIAREVERARQAGDDPGLASSLMAARRRLAKIERDQERLAVGFRTRTGRVLELLEREIGRAEVERQQTMSEIAEIEARISARQQAARRWEDVERYCQRVAGRLDSFDFDQKRLALEALAVRVTANGRDWRIDGGIPFGSGEGVLSQTATTSARRPTSRRWRPRRTWSAWA
jgi:site-specific DNA recombinase